MIRTPAYQDSMSTVEVKSITHLKKGVRVFCGDHRFEELSFAMPTEKIAMASCYADCCKAIFLGTKRVVMVRHHTWNGESKLISKMEFAEPESFGLEVVQGSFDELGNDIFHKNQET